MSRQIVIIEGHPDPSAERLCRALATAYAEGAVEAGHTVQRINLAMLDFPLLRTEADFTDGTPPEILAPAIAALLAADHVVIIFPLWLGTMPALLKAFLEQVFRPGTAFAYQPNGLPKKLLAGRSGRLVVTMGMPALLYRWFFGGHGIRGMERNILNFVGIKPVHESFYGNVVGASPATRDGWLADMRAHGRRGD